jgi:hypothetical protein
MTPQQFAEAAVTLRDLLNVVRDIRAASWRHYLLTSLTCRRAESAWSAVWAFAAYLHEEGHLPTVKLDGEEGRKPCEAERRPALRPKAGFTLAEHIAFGRRLKGLRNRELIQLCVTVGNAFPKSHRIQTLADRALAAIDRLRCELDNRVCEENPEQPDHVVLRCYYGQEPVAPPVDREVPA